jgi:hypothetical protein
MGESRPTVVEFYPEKSEVADLLEYNCVPPVQVPSVSFPRPRVDLIEFEHLRGREYK